MALKYFTKFDPATGEILWNVSQSEDQPDPDPETFVPGSHNGFDKWVDTSGDEPTVRDREDVGQAVGLAELASGVCKLVTGLPAGAQARIGITGPQRPGMEPRVIKAKSGAIGCKLDDAADYAVELVGRYRGSWLVPALTAEAAEARALAQVDSEFEDRAAEFMPSGAADRLLSAFKGPSPELLALADKREAARSAIRSAKGAAGKLAAARVKW